MQNYVSRITMAIAPAIMLFMMAVTLAGCGGSSGGSRTGTLSIAMSDGPGPGVTAVNVTIDRVEAHVNSAWIPITTAPQTFNLLDLVKNEAILGSANLPTGHYTQVRFFPSAATLTNGTGVHTVTIPSAVRTGVKVNVDYTIGPDQVTTVLLDFNVEKSIVLLGSGEFVMKPVVPAVVKVLSGTVTGSVTSGGSPRPDAIITATYTSGSSYAIGTEVNTSTSLADGTFKVWALLPGTYTITAIYTDPVTSATTSATATGVVVSANSNTDVGAIPLL